VSGAILDHLRPHEIAVAFDNRVRGAEGRRLFRIERRVNPAKDDERAPLAGDLADCVALNGVARMNANPDDIAGRHGGRVPRLERFVRDDRIAVGLGGRGRKNIEPPRRDHANAEGERTGVDEMNLHLFELPPQTGIFILAARNRQILHRARRRRRRVCSSLTGPLSTAECIQ